MRTSGTASRSPPPELMLPIDWVCCWTRVWIAPMSPPSPTSMVLFWSEICGGGGACSTFSCLTFSSFLVSISDSVRSRVNSIFTTEVAAPRDQHVQEGEERHRDEERSHQGHREPQVRELRGRHADSCLLPARA